MNTIKLNRILFVYALNGKIKCYSHDELKEAEPMLTAEGWGHTATIDSALWIEAISNNCKYPYVMIDELQFPPNN
jgi:hypothetical protein